MKLLMLKGLPASGKSTFAKELSDQGWVRVNKDDMRSMLHNGKWSKGNEKFVLKLRDHIVRSALSVGKNVVVDDTNFAPIHAATLKQIAEDNRATFEEKFFDTPLGVCIERDLKRLNSVGESVIRKMHNQYLRKIQTPREGDKAAILVDIDGTLAHMNGRSPYDETRVLEDDIDTSVKLAVAAVRLASSVSNIPIEIIVMSGRHETCREDTEKWLEMHKVPYDRLLMRPAGDNRPDYIVKEELYEDNINGKYDVGFVLDDRNQVVNMWREKGLKCFQVAEGDF